MRIAKSQVALSMGAVLGAFAVVLILIHRDNAPENEVAVPTRNNSIHARPGNDRSSLNGPGGRLGREPSAAPGDSQAPDQKSGAAGKASVHGEEAAFPPYGEVFRQDQADASPAEAVAFRTSQSVEEQCRVNPLPTESACKEVRRLLEEMSREERDEEWASRAESRIRAIISARGNGMQIRALECKISLCAIETESSADVHLTFFDQSQQVSAGIMDDGDWTIAWENDRAGNRITITARVYSRRVQ